MRLPNSVHTSRPWRIHELTRDFRLEDVWELPGVGGPDDFPLLVQLIASGDPSQSSSVAVRTLFAIRWKIGELLGWDGPDAGLGSRVATLRDRLPADLRDAPCGPDFDALPFTSVYLLEDEWAAEIANRTMHGVMHIGRVSDDTGGFRAHMAVYVKPNGLLGSAYMAAIRPFRHLIVYPPMLRDMGRNWRAAAACAGRLPAVERRVPLRSCVGTIIQASVELFVRRLYRRSFFSSVFMGGFSIAKALFLAWTDRSPSSRSARRTPTDAAADPFLTDRGRSGFRARFGPEPSSTNPL